MKTYSPIILYLLFPLLSFSQVTYVDIDATGNNNGSSWTDAYTDLALAMDNAVYGDSIWIADGTYFPTNDNNRHKHFTLKNGVKIFGGFAGNEITFEERDWANNLSVLDGNIGDIINSTDNVLTVLYVNICDSSTRIDGITIQNGYADGGISDSTATNSGGGIFIKGSDIIENQVGIINSTIRGNYAIERGGGVLGEIVNNNGLSGVSIIGCLIDGNSAGQDGGGVSIGGYSLSGTIRVENTVFTNNYVEGINTLDPDGSALQIGYGGGDPFIENYRNYLIKNCSFISNISEEANAGTFTFEAGWGKMNLIIDSCSFIGNIIDEGYSGFEFQDFNNDTTSTITIQNCIFEDNYSRRATLALFAQQYDVTIQNCRFSRNETEDVGSGLAGSGNVKVLNCLFEENSTFDSNAGFGLGTGHFTDSLLISNCTFVGNYSYDGFFLFVYDNDEQIGGPMRIENCIFRGNPYGPYDQYGSYIQCKTGAKPIIDNCVIDVPICSMPTDSLLSCGPGLIFDEAIFVDSAGGDFRLSPCSPGINAGVNDFYASYFPEVDLAGQNRIQEGQIDMGAYELGLPILEVELIDGFICHDDSLGTVAFQSQNACAPIIIYGPDGSPNLNNYFENLPAGTHEFILEDALGRSDTLILTLEAPDPIEVTVQIDHATNGQSFDGSLVVEEITGGIPPYDLLWSLAGDTTYQLQNIGPALYALTVTDSLGCEFIEYYLVEARTSAKEITIENQILVYPNPFEKEIRIKFPDQINNIEVFDYTGRLIESQSDFISAAEITIGADWLSGVYIIVFYDETGRQYNRRVVKI